MTKTRKPKSHEYFIASAIFVNGLIYPGARHSQCAKAMSYQGYRKPLSHTQGFLLSSGKFIDRIDGFKLAKETGQILPSSRIEEGFLYSENLR